MRPPLPERTQHRHWPACSRDTPNNLSGQTVWSTAVSDHTDDVSRGVRLGLLAYVMWGFLTVYWKQLDAFNALELIGWRMTFAAVVMAALITARGTWPKLRSAFADRGTLARLVAAAFLLSANWGSYLWAVVNDRVIETALGYFMAPLATMAIGVFVLRETPTAPQKVAFVLASIAVVILTVSSGQPPWIALILAATWSLYALAKRKIDLDAIDNLAGETFVLLGPAIVWLVIVSGRADSVVSTATGVEWAFVVGTGAITAIPLMLFAAAAKSIPFTLLGPLNLIVPVINFGLGWLLYDEPMPLDRLIGFAFVWAALLVVMYDRIAASRARTA
jgi:chloramphenicol-sensitive protein RarD